METVNERRRRTALIDTFVLCGFWAALFLLTRDRLTDPFIDYGRELYVAWRVSEGDVLYRDIMYFNGPLAPLLNGLLFHVFGVSIRVLQTWNAVLILAISMMIRRCFSRLLHRTGGMMAATIFLTVFAFGQLSINSTYQYVAPYSHDLTYGIALCFAALTIALSAISRPNAISMIATGWIVGLTLLTKPEIFAALATTSAMFLFMIFVRNRSRRPLFHCGAFVVSAVLPAIIAWAYFLPFFTPASAAQAVFSPWVAVLNTEVANSFFYRGWAGLDRPFFNIAMTAISGVGTIACFGVNAYAASHIPHRNRLHAVGGSFAIWTVVFLSAEAWPHMLIAPFLMAGMAIILSDSIARKERGITGGLSADKRDGFLLIVIFAAALMLKMVLHPRIGMYGFVLAMPATICLLLWAAFMTPCNMLRTQTRKTYGFFSTGMIAAVCFVTVLHSIISLHTKIPSISGDGQRIFVLPVRSQESAVIAMTIESLRASMKPDDSVMIFPEGAMINYVLRKPTGIPYSTFMGAEYFIFGEPAFLHAMQSSQPDFVVVLQRDMTEYGFSRFGITEEYGLSLRNFIEANYDPVQTIGAHPIDSAEAGAAIYRKR